MGKKRRKKLPVDTLSGAIAARIRELGLTSYAVGKMSGVDPSMIGRFLAGERTLSLKTAERLCKALDLVLVPRRADEPAVPESDLT
jgi:transcriptional regulator with XRE-family HTH domain